MGVTIKQLAGRAQKAADKAAELAVEIGTEQALELASEAQIAADVASEAETTADAAEAVGVAEGCLEALRGLDKPKKEEPKKEDTRQDNKQNPAGPEKSQEDLADMGYGPIWKVGQGQTTIRVIARTKGDAMAKAAEKMPLLLAIGMVAEQEETVEGFPVVALIPEDYKL